MTDIDQALLDEWRSSRHKCKPTAAAIYEAYVRGQPPGTRVPRYIDASVLPVKCGVSTVGAAKRLLGDHGALTQKERVWVVAPRPPGPGPGPGPE